MKSRFSWLAVPAVVAVFAALVYFLVVSVANAPDRAKASAQTLVDNLNEQVKRDGVAPPDPRPAGAELHDGMLYYDGYRIAYQADGSDFLLRVVVTDDTFVTYNSSTGEWVVSGRNN